MARGNELTELDRELQLQIEERQRAEAERDRSEGNLELASQSAGLGVWSWDLETDELTWSESLYDLLGVPRDTPASLEGFMERVHPEDRPRLEVNLEHLDALPSKTGEEFRVVRPSGEICWFESRYRIFRDAEGRPRHMTGVLYDVSERKRVELELERRVAQRTAELLQVNTELEAFAYSASHDLRAPLRAIDGYAHVLIEEYGEALEDDARHYLERVRDGATRMGKIIDSLLGLARLSRASTRPQTVHLSALASSVAQGLRNEEPGRVVDVRIEAGVTVEGDQDLLRIVLANLLGNAWKFTRGREGACIEFGTIERDGVREFFVRDNGVGFDMQFSGKLFEPFQRLHSESEFEGTGIGLATVQRIVHRHGGQVRAESRPGAGATFAFTINPGVHKLR